VTGWGTDPSERAEKQQVQGIGPLARKCGDSAFLLLQTNKNASRLEANESLGIGGGAVHYGKVINCSSFSASPIASVL
jgi:hypothetical protein